MGEGAPQIENENIKALKAMLSDLEEIVARGDVNNLPFRVRDFIFEARQQLKALEKTAGKK